MRRNPAGGFLPAIGGFLAVPIATHFAAAMSARVLPPSNGAPGVNNRAQVFDVATAVLSWAGRDRVRDAGWRSFVTGGMWGSIVSAVLRPVVYGMMAARGELGASPLPAIDRGDGVAPVFSPTQSPARPQIAEADDEPEYRYAPESTNYAPADEGGDSVYDYADAALDVFDAIPGVGF